MEIKKSAWSVVVIFSLFSSGTANTAQWTGILDPSRATDWSGAGVQGGIPNRTTMCATLGSAGQAPSFVQSVTAAQINNAIQSCSNNQVVFLNAGTYNLNTGILLSKSNITLRGAGANSTLLRISGITAVGCHIGEGRVLNMCTNAGLGNIGSDPASIEHSTTWTANFAKGTQVITLASASGLSVGQTIWLDQMDEPSDGFPATGDVYVCDVGDPNCGNNGTGESYARSGRGVAEGHIVAAISGNNVTINPPVIFPTFRTALSPGAWWGNTSTVLQNTGLEDLTVDPTPVGGGGVHMINATNCWIKGVRMQRTDSSGSQAFILFTVNVMNSTIQDNYIYGPVTSQLIGVYAMAYHMISSSLITNNILHTNSSSIVMNAPFYGNVISYNYFDNGVGASIILHGLGGMNLYEGNNAKNFSGDTIHGSHAFETLFRNHFDGATHNPSFTETRAGLALYSNNRFFNSVGNVFGAANWDTYQTLLSNGLTSIYVLGWQGTGSGTPVTNDPNDSRTLLRWGNWDNVNNATRFLASEVPSGIPNFSNPVPANQTLPVSFYLSAKPSWWGSTQWPPIGPDVTGGNVSNSPTGGHANKIPARLCFENTTKTNGVLNFDADTCYGTAAPTSRCDVNNDNVTNVSDVQLCVNQAIGVVACGSGDINNDNSCNVIDVQRVVNAALGGQCVTTP